VQVLSGTAFPTNLDGQAGSVRIIGRIPLAVFTEKGPTFSLTLPRYGRVHLSPAFKFPQLPNALDLGIPGQWRRPEQFEVVVEAGSNDTSQRVDLAAPDLVFPTRLYWESDEAVTVVLRRTDLRLEARQQTAVFILGAVVGAGASTIVVAIERWFTHVRLRRRPKGGPTSPPSLGVAGSPPLDG
jgi:hypothetical protein